MNFRKSNLLLLGILSLLGMAAHGHRADDEGENLTRFESWPAHSSPMSESGEAAIEAFLQEGGSSSFLVIFRGKIAYQYGDIHEKHLIHSIRKALLVLLFGEAVDDGRIDLDETLSTLDLAEPGVEFSAQEKQATVRQLLQSRSGIYLPAAAESVRMTESRPERGSHQPGESYYYNNWSFNSVGTLFEARTGRSIYEAFDTKLAKPLGMTSYAGKIGSFTIENGVDDDLNLEGFDGFYLIEADKSRHPAYHFRLSSHDLALIGQMLAQGGEWQGEQLIAADWIEEITRCYSLLNPDIGGGRSSCYGMMWQVVQQDGRPSAFSHTGLRDHMVYVHPGAQLVLVHRVDTEDGDSQMKAPVQNLIGLTFSALSPN